MGAYMGSFVIFDSGIYELVLQARPFTHSLLRKGLVTRLHPFRPRGMQLISSGFTHESRSRK